MLSMATCKQTHHQQEAAHRRRLDGPDAFTISSSPTLACRLSRVRSSRPAATAAEPALVGSAFAAAPPPLAAQQQQQQVPPQVEAERRLGELLDGVINLMAGGLPRGGCNVGGVVQGAKDGRWVRSC